MEGGILQCHLWSMDNVCRVAIAVNWHFDMQVCVKSSSLILVGSKTWNTAEGM